MSYLKLHTYIYIIFYVLFFSIYFYIVSICVSCVSCMCMRKEFSYQYIKVHGTLYVCPRLALYRNSIYYSTLCSNSMIVSKPISLPNLIFVPLETRAQGQQQQFFFICSTTNIINRMKQAPRQAPPQQQQSQLRQQHQPHRQRKHQVTCKRRNHRHHPQRRHQV